MRFWNGEAIACPPARAPDVHFGHSHSLTLPVSQGTRMPVWKVLLILAFGGICLGLGLATVIVPMTIAPGNSRWLWLAGLLLATAGMGTLFRLVLNSADRALDLKR